MDSKKPGEDKDRSARDRAEALDRNAESSSAAKPETPVTTSPSKVSASGPAEASDTGTGGSERPRLTEKQRIEARQRRRERKRKPVKGNPLSRGVRATANEVQRSAFFLGHAVMAGIDAIKPVGGIVVSALVTAFGAIAVGLQAFGRLISSIFSALGRVVLTLDRLITPRRALIAIAFVAGGLLVASQLIDYRAIEIGQPGYVQVEEITGAPQVEKLTPIDTHSILILVLAALALAGSVATVLTGRRRYAGAIALAGAGTVLVALAIDLPRALDAEEARLSFAGVEAVLLSGFWLELGAGAVLAISGLALAVSRSGNAVAAEDGPSRRRPDRDRTERERERDSTGAGRAVAGGRA